jgi:hypothetical protein
MGAILHASYGNFQNAISGGKPWEGSNSGTGIHGK